MSDSLWLHGLQHSRVLCLPLSPGFCSNSCPLTQWCYLTISSSAALFFCFQSVPASGLFLMSQIFASGGQRIGASASASFLPMNIQSGFPLGLTGLISLQAKGLLRVFSSTTIWKHNSLSFGLLYVPPLTSVHDYWKNQSFDCMDLCWPSDVGAF